MTKTNISPNTNPTFVPSGGSAWLNANLRGPRIMLAPPGEGEGGGDDAGGDDAAAAKAAADKAASDKAAADKAAADKTAAEAEEKAERDRLEKKKGAQVTEAEAELLREVMERKREAKRLKAEMDAANEKLKAYDGLDPAKLKDLIAKQAEAEKAAQDAEADRLKKAGEWDRLKEMMASAHKTEKETLETAKNAAEAKLQESEKLIDDLTIGNAFTTSRFISTDLVLPTSMARSVFGPYFEREDGKIVGYDKPRGAANRTKMVDGAGEPIAFEDAIKKIVENSPEKDQLLKSKIKVGSGENKGKGTKKAESEEDAPRGVAALTAALNGGALNKLKSASK